MEKKWRISIIVAIVALVVCIATTTFALWDKTTADFDIKFNVGERIVISQVSNKVDMNGKKLVPAGSIIDPTKEVTSFNLANPVVKYEKSNGAEASDFAVQYSYEILNGTTNYAAYFELEVKNGATIIPPNTKSNLLATLSGAALTINIKLKAATDGTYNVSDIANKSFKITIKFTVVNATVV